MSEPLIVLSWILIVWLGACMAIAFIYGLMMGERS